MRLRRANIYKRMFKVLEAMEINVFFCLLIIVRQPWSQPCENTLKSGFIGGFCGGRCIETESEYFLWGSRWIR